MLDWLKEWLNRALQWFIDAVLYLADLIFSTLLSLLIVVLETIPVPSFVQNASVYIAAIPPEVLFFTGMVKLGFGLQVVISASLLRFLIRRLPVVG